MNTNTISGLTVEVDYRKPLPDIIAAGKYDCVNPNITAMRFPVEGTGKKSFHTRLFHSRFISSSQEVAAAMKKENFTPGSHLHGPAFGAAFPEAQRKCPGGWWAVDGSYCRA
jgi:hypothetical protein